MTAGILVGFARRAAVLHLEARLASTVFPNRARLFVIWLNIGIWSNCRSWMLFFLVFYNVFAVFARSNETCRISLLVGCERKAARSADLPSPLPYLLREWPYAARDRRHRRQFSRVGTWTFHICVLTPTRPVFSEIFILLAR